MKNINILSILLLVISLHAHKKTQIYKDLFLVVTSYNNAQKFKNNPHLSYCEKNLQSLIEQEYPHDKVHIFYIDDCSRDDTFKLVKNFIRSHTMPFEFTLYRNKMRRGKAANLYSLINRLPPHALVVEIDGDDWLAHKKSLQEINRVFSDETCWVAHGGHRLYPSGGLMGSAAISEQTLRKGSFRDDHADVGQLRVFYAELFQAISKDDFLYNNKFLPAAVDVAYMMPMYEMAGAHHIREFKKVIYIYNVENQLNDFKVNRNLQLAVTDYIYSKSPYKPWIGDLKKARS